MTGPNKPSEAVESRSLTIRWPAEDFAKIEEAAKAKSEQEQYTVTPTDIIRSGALMRANEILGAA